jgi:hypothetical protein
VRTQRIVSRVIPCGSALFECVIVFVWVGGSMCFAFDIAGSRRHHRGRLLLPPPPPPIRHLIPPLRRGTTVAVAAAVAAVQIGIGIAIIVIVIVIVIVTVIIGIEARHRHRPPHHLRPRLPHRVIIGTGTAIVTATGIEAPRRHHTVALNDLPHHGMIHSDSRRAYIRCPPLDSSLME